MNCENVFVEFFEQFLNDKVAKLIVKSMIFIIFLGIERNKWGEGE